MHCICVLIHHTSSSVEMLQGTSMREHILPSFVVCYVTRNRMPSIIHDLCVTAIHTVDSVQGLNVNDRFNVWNL